MVNFPVKMTFETDKQSLKKSQKEAQRNAPKAKGGGGGAAFAGGLAGGILGAFSKALGPLADLLGALVSIIGIALFPLLKPFLVLFLKVGLELLKFLKDPGKAFASLITAIGGAIGLDASQIQTFIDTFTNIFNNLKTIWTGLTTFLGGLFSGDFKAAAEGLKSVFMELPDLFLNVVQFVGNMLFTALAGVGAVIDEILGTSFKEIFINLLDIFNGIVEFVRAFFTGDWQGAWEALKKIGMATFDLLLNLFSSAWEILKTLGKLILDGIIKVLTVSFEALKNLGSLIKDSILGFVKGIAAKFNPFGGSSSKVNDAIITPQGNIIRTNPQDFIFATKDPSTLGGGGGTNNITVNVQGVVDDTLMRQITQRLQRDLNLGGRF